MALTFGDNISYQGKKPLDARMLFATISAMKSYSENYLPALAMCQNEEDGNLYIYNVANTVDETTGKWRKFEGGGSGGGSTVEVNPALTSGTKIGDISVDGVKKDLFAPEYTEATTSAAGLMSAADKTKLNGVAENANNYSLPTASASTLGGVKVGNHLNIANGVLSADANVVMGAYEYSTNEVCIGKWVDGRPIYRKMIANGTSLTANGVTTLLSSTDGINILTFRGYLLADNAILDINRYTSATDYAYIVRNASGLVRIGNYGSTSTKAYVWMTYTKTTDAANSFTLDKITTGSLDTVATDAEVTEVLG